MKVYTGANIRNVALVGHSGSGKTQLASAMLFDAGSITRLGLVDDGTTVTDFDEVVPGVLNFASLPCAQSRPLQFLLAIYLYELPF